MYKPPEKIMSVHVTNVILQWVAEFCVGVIKHAIIFSFIFLKLAMMC